MATKEERDLDDELGPSPHPLFEDKDEPWKDPELMLRLREQHDYQYEIAHVLGATPGQVSYWMEKAVEWGRQEALKAGALCQRCEDAETPGGSATGNGFCVECLAEVRRGDGARPEVVDT